MWVGCRRNRVRQMVFNVIGNGTGVDRELRYRSALPGEDSRGGAMHVGMRNGTFRPISSSGITNGTTSFSSPVTGTGGSNEMAAKHFPFWTAGMT